MRNRTEKHLLFLAFIVTLLSGCVATTVKQDTMREAIDVPTGIDAKPLLFKKGAVKLPRGEKIVSNQIAPLTWPGWRVTLSGDEFTEVFLEDLEKDNYPLIGNPGALFENPEQWKKELIVAGFAKEMVVNICYLMAGFRNYTTQKGEPFINGEWQTFSHLDRKVVYTTTTEGSGKLKQPSPIGSKEFGENIHTARVGVVAVFVGDGYGSGFVIDNSGLMLTNAHVVGGTKLVKFKLVTGHEILGEVLRNKGKRDGVLVKVVESKLMSLPILVTDANIGEEFYVFGSPLDEKWSATMNKGIVCGHRGEDGMEYMQLNIRLADTTTNHIPQSVHRYDQNSISLRNAGVGQEQHRVDESDRLKFFLFLYCHTYESKDIDKFATFFAHDALENNKPFHELLPKYRRNMEMIESLDYRIELVDYSFQANTGNITLQGKFFIKYLLYGGTWKEKSGNISMELTKRGISYLVKRLNYGY